MTRKIRYKEPASNFTRMAAPAFEPANRASVGMDKFMGEYYYIHVDKIIPYKNQARSAFNDEELQGLAETIKEHGVRSPLTVIRSVEFDGKYEVVSGERRLRASKIVGLEKVPCIILDASSNAEEIALIENVQRTDLHPIELARGLKVVVDHYGRGGQTEIEKKIGIPQSRISEALKLLALSNDIQELCIQENYTGRDNLLALLKLDTDNDRKSKILGNRMPNGKTTSLSVLRIRIEDNHFKIQKNAISKLSDLQKKELLNHLKEIISEVS